MDPTEWLPTYPDRPERHRRPLADALASQPPYSSAIFPVPDVLASLTFLPSYPDRVPHLRVPREQMTVTTAAIVVTAVAPLAWVPRFPDRVPHHRTPLGAHLSVVAPPPGADLVVAASLAWSPHYPAWVSRRRAVAQMPSERSIPNWQAVASAGLLDQVLLVDGALTTPTFLTAVTVGPALVAETCEAPALIHEVLDG